MGHKFLLLPTRLETDLFSSSLKSIGMDLVKYMHQDRFCFHWPKGELYIFQGGLGKERFYQSCQHLLMNDKKVDFLLALGSAGSLSPEMIPGDILVGTHSIEHQSLTFPRISGDPNLLKASYFSNSGPSKVYHGGIASGDENIQSLERKQELYRKTCCMAVAWEGFGAATACNEMGIPFLEIRSITDGADKEVPTSFKENLPMAIHNLARWTMSFLEHW